MKLNIQILMLFTFIMTINSSALGQGYLSKFVPLDFAPNTRNFSYEDNEYIISSINFIDDISSSTIIRVDENFDTIETINHFGVFFGRMTPQRINGKYYSYGSDQTQNGEAHLLIEMDKDFIEVKRDTLYPEGETFNANGMTVIGDKIIGSAWDYYDCDEHVECTSMNYKVLTTYGNEQYNIESDQENLGMYGFLMKFTNDGELLWRRRYKQSNYPLASPIIKHIIEHENGDISMLGREASVDGFFMWMLRVNEHGCFGDENCDIPMVLPTEDLQADEGNEIKIYPNPASSYVNIVSTNDSKISHVVFYDIQGRLQSEVNEIDSNQVEITELDQGLYFIKIELESGDSVFKKLLIKR